MKYIIVVKGYPLVFIIHIIIRFFCYDYFNMPKNWIISYLKKVFICSIKIALIYFVYDRQMLLNIKIASNFKNMISSSLLSQKVHSKNRKNELFWNGFKEFQSVIHALKNTHDYLLIALIRASFIFWSFIIFDAIFFSA